MLPLLLISFFLGVSAQTTSIYANPALDPQILSAFPSSQPCAQYALTEGIQMAFSSSCSGTSIWTCICSADYPSVLSSLVATNCVTLFSETDNPAVATSAFASFCSQLLVPTTTPTGSPGASGGTPPTSPTPTSSTSSTTLSAKSSDQNQKIGLGVGIGLGVPILLAAAVGIWFVRGGKKKQYRVEPIEQEMGEPIHLGRM